jgi:outer membrane autotransporter protein
MKDLGYGADTFLLSIGADYKGSSPLSFLDRYIVGIFSSYANASMDYRGSESLKGDKTKQNSLIFGYYSGYGVKRWTGFSSSLVSITRHRNSLSMHSGNDLSGPLEKINTCTFCGHSTRTDIGLSYKYPFKQLIIEPMAFLKYGSAAQKKHSNGNVSLPKQKSKYLQPIVGIRLEMPVEIGSHKLNPHFFIGFARDMYRHNNIPKTVNDLQGNQVRQTLFERERNSMMTEVGLSMLIKDTMDADISYRGEYFRHNKANAVIAGINYKF